MATNGTPPTRSSLFSGILKGTALYSVAIVGQRIGSVVLLPINTRFLTTTDFGILDLLEKVGSLVSVLLGLNISAALGYFYFEKKSQEERSVVVSSLIAGVLLVGCVAAGVGIGLASPISRTVFHNIAVRPYVMLLFAGLPIAFALEAEFGWLRVVDRPVMYTTTSFLRLGVSVALTVVLLTVFRLRVLGVLISTLVAGIVATTFLTWYCFREVRFGFSLPIFTRMSRFAVPLSLGTIGMFVIHFGDSFILPQYRGFAELGIYSLAYKIGMLITMLSSAFYTYWSAQVFEVAQRDDSETVIARIFTYFVLAVCFCSVALVLICRPALRVMVAAPFQPAAAVAPVIVLAYFLRALSSFFQSFFLVHARPAYDAICSWIAAAICLVGYFTLIPRFGMWGAAWATVLAFLCISLMSAAWTHRLRPFRLEGHRLAKIGLVSFFLLAVHYAMTAPSLIVDIARSALLVAAFPGLLWILRFPEVVEIDKLRSIIGRWRAVALERSGLT